MAATGASWRESFLVGVLVFGIAGVGCVLLAMFAVVRLIRSDGNLSDMVDPTVLIFASTAAAVIGVIAWRLIAGAPGSGPGRGALAGLVVGLLAHPLCWLLLAAYQIAGVPEARSRSVHDLIFDLGFMTVWISISSLGLIGWITGPLGAALGYAAKRFTASTSRA